MADPAIEEVIRQIQQIIARLAGVPMVSRSAALGVMRAVDRATSTLAQPSTPDEIALASQYGEAEWRSMMEAQAGATPAAPSLEEPFWRLTDADVRRFVQTLGSAGLQQEFRDETGEKAASAESPPTDEQLAQVVESARGNPYAASVAVTSANLPYSSRFTQWAMRRLLEQVIEERGDLPTVSTGMGPSVGYGHEQAARVAWEEAQQEWEGPKFRMGAAPLEEEQAEAEAARIGATPPLPTTVTVVGPDGKPMEVTLAAHWQPPSADELPPSLLEIAQRLMDEEGMSRDEAFEQATQEVEQWMIEHPGATGPDDNPLLGGMPSGYAAFRQMQVYRPPVTIPEGGPPPFGPLGSPAISTELPPGRMEEVALEPQYHVDFIGQYFAMPFEQVAELEDRMVRAGILEEGSFNGGNPVETWQAFKDLLGYSNWMGYDYMTTLGYLESSGVTRPKPEFTPSAYVAPDYDTLAESVYVIFARDLGRDPEDWEVQQLASRLGSHYREQYQNQVEAERQAFMEEHEIPVDTGLARGQTAEAERLSQQAGQSLGYIPRGAAPPMAGVDPYSSFMQFFRQRYRPEMDLRKQVSSMENASDMLFGSLARMDSMIGGG